VVAVVALAVVAGRAVVARSAVVAGPECRALARHDIPDIS
jgi:hypothetical protein